MQKTRLKPKTTYRENDDSPVNLETLPPQAEAASAPVPQDTHESITPREAAKPAEAKEPIRRADPRTLITVSLSPTQGGPSMRLLRSHRYRQLQVRFEGQQPDDQHLVRLKEAGWIDRTESEGIWTKQIPPGQWQPVADGERLFKEIANAIRKDKGLEPVLQGLSVA